MAVRRFVNLLMRNLERGTYSLRRFDLSLNDFFYATPEELASHGRALPLQRSNPSSSSSTPRYQEKPANNGNRSKRKKNQLEVVPIRLPPPLFTMRPAPSPAGGLGQCKVDAYALTESKVVFSDRHFRVLSYDAGSGGCALTMPMPSLHGPKLDPLAVTIPHGRDGGEGRVYIIERTLWPEKDRSFQFEAVVSDRLHAGGYRPFGTWECQSLPLPPLSLSSEQRAFVCSAAAVGDAICVSLSGIGTYGFDTASHTWSHAGDWMMPFSGVAEHVPELGLWFGISRRDDHLPCAADLSRGQPPEPGLFWGHDGHLPEEWYYSLGSPSQIVSLGSGRFCILRFLETSLDPDFVHVGKSYAVFTGLEIMLPGNGNKHGLRMVSHNKYRRCRNRPETNSIQCLL